DEVKNLFDRLDSYLAHRGIGATPGDTLLAHSPLTGHFLTVEPNPFVRNEDLAAVERMLATAGLDSVIPSDSQLLWGDADQSFSGVTGRQLYLVKRQPEMTGGSIASAEARVGLYPQNPGGWGVSMKMTPRGRGEFAAVTGNNVGRQLAIVL